MELPVTASVNGVVSQVRCTEGRAVTVAQTLVVLSPVISGKGDDK
jgi:biotin carboxyl carrier protein